MALIKCPECGRDISDKAAACIYCGYPLEYSAPPKEEVLLEELYYLCSPPRSVRLSVQDLNLQDKIEFHKESPLEGYYIHGGIKTKYIFRDNLLMALDRTPLMIVEPGIVADVSILYQTEIPNTVSSDVKIFNDNGVAEIMLLPDGIARIAMLRNGSIVRVDDGIYARVGNVLKTMAFRSSGEVEIKYFGIYNNRLCKNTYCSKYIFLKTYNEELQEYTQKVREIGSSKTVYQQLQGTAPWVTQYYNYPCPNCGAYKVRPAKWDDKSLSIAFWGIASDKIGKSYKCENCGRMW